METREASAASPRDLLAAERTFLAWTRTGLALLFLRKFKLIGLHLPIHSFGHSLWFGTTLILVGVVVYIVFRLRYLRLLAMMTSNAKSLGIPRPVPWETPFSWRNSDWQ